MLGDHIARDGRSRNVRTRVPGAELRTRAQCTGAGVVRASFSASVARRSPAHRFGLSQRRALRRLTRAASSGSRTSRPGHRDSRSRAGLSLRRFRAESRPGAPSMRVTIEQGGAGARSVRVTASRRQYSDRFREFDEPKAPRHGPYVTDGHAGIIHRPPAGSRSVRVRRRRGKGWLADSRGEPGA